MLARRPALLWIAFLAFVSLGLPDTALGVAWPSLQRSFQIPPSWLGALLGTSMLGYFSASVFSGKVVARFGIGSVLAASSLSVSLALFGFALAQGWLQFLPFSLLWGLGSGAIDSGLNGFAARHFSVKQLNLLHACWGLGATIGPLVMTLFVAQGWDHRPGYACLGAMLAIMTLLFFVTRRRFSASESAPVSAGVPAPHKTLKEAILNPTLQRLMLVFFLYTATEATVGQWCFSWLGGVRGLSIESAGALTGAYWASLTVGRLLLGGVVERVGSERMMQVVLRGALLGVALFVGLPGVLGGVGLLVLGLCLATVFPTLIAMTPARVGPELARHAAGLEVSAATLGSTIGPSVMGFTVARYGLFAIGSVSAVMVLALFLAYRIGSVGGGGATPVESA